MSREDMLYCPWEDCSDKKLGWTRRIYPDAIPKRSSHQFWFFSCLSCKRAFVQNKRSRKCKTMLVYYQETKALYKSPQQKPSEK